MPATGHLLALFGTALAATLALLASAQAQTTNKFVSANGNDAANCQRATPCKTLQRGIDITPPGAVLQILDSGAYGPANIAKSITIDATGVAATTQNITINSASAIVTLRGLLLSGRGLIGDISGIDVRAAKLVHIVRCEVERFPGRGFLIAATGATHILDSAARENAEDGVAFSTGALTIDNSRFENNGGNGISAANGKVAIARSLIAGNGGGALIAVSSQLEVSLTSAVKNQGDGFSASNGSSMTLDQVTSVSNTGSGAIVGAGSTLIISDSTVSYNSVGLNTAGGSMLTRGNNTVFLNVPNNTVGSRGVLSPI